MDPDQQPSGHVTTQFHSMHTHICFFVCLFDRFTVWENIFKNIVLNIYHRFRPETENEVYYRKKKCKKSGREREKRT